MQPENKKLGLTSILKLKFIGKDRDDTAVDTQFLADLSRIKTVGRYEIVSKLGQGSMGVVYLGRDPYIKRDVAIKISRPHQDFLEGQADEYRKRFFLEAQSAGRLTHPNIVAIHDAGMEHDFFYIAMEYVDGLTIEELCSRDNLLPLSTAVKIIFAACRALDYAHKRGVVHRDIKPSNMMLNKHGRIKITDFGIAHIKADHGSHKGIMGSPSYMSPEQVKEEVVDEKSDIFSLGCVLYEILTGTKAFSGENHFSIMYKITHGLPEPISEVRTDLPDILAKITNKALTQDPDKRYQTCMDLAYDLRVALRGLDHNINKPRIGDVVDYVNQVSFFESFTKEQVNEMIMASDLIKIKKGNVLVSEGQIDDTFFIILSGKVAVRKGDNFIAVIERGECFGEMSYLGGQSRAATVVTMSDCVLMKISATLLDRSSKTIQLLFLKQFAKTLLTRLARRNS